AGISSATRISEVAMFSRIRTLALAALLTAVLASPALAKGPPWISIELTVNPYDRTMKGAFLLVHAFHHQTPIGFPIEGTAEGMVNGERRTVKLEFAETSRDGVYALKRTWAEEGVWTLVIRVNQGPAGAEGGTAAAGRRRSPWPAVFSEVPFTLTTEEADYARTFGNWWTHTDGGRSLDGRQLQRRRGTDLSTASSGALRRVPQRRQRADADHHGGAGAGHAHH